MQGNFPKVKAQPMRSDKIFELTIPNYRKEGEVVHYQIRIRNLMNNCQYSKSFRFKELKQINSKLEKLNLKESNPFRQTELPKFPKPHLWKKTNENKSLIKKRKIALEEYFSHFLNDPYIRGTPEIKAFIADIKLNNPKPRWSISKKSNISHQRTRSCSGRSEDTSLPVRIE